MGKYFGTDGFRGEANVDLTVEHAYKVGRFLGWCYGQKMPDERCRVYRKGYQTQQLYV
jgi:phosphoglucosamine mutase